MASVQPPCPCVSEGSWAYPCNFQRLDNSKHGYRSQPTAPTIIRHGREGGMQPLDAGLFRQPRIRRNFCMFGLPLLHLSLRQSRIAGRPISSLHRLGGDAPPGPCFSVKLLNPSNPVPSDWSIVAAGLVRQHRPHAAARRPMTVKTCCVCACRSMLPSSRQLLRRSVPFACVTFKRQCVTVKDITANPRAWSPVKSTHHPRSRFSLPGALRLVIRYMHLPCLRLLALLAQALASKEP